MHLVVAILIGMAMGTMVELLLPGHHPSELLLAMLLGIAGALIARYIGWLAGWYGSDEPASYISSIFGSLLVLILYGLVFRKPPKPK